MNKLKLLEITFNKLSDDSTYMAHYLKKASLLENKSQAEMQKLLNCPEEDYYKLGMCQAPSLQSPDFKLRIKKIASYVNTSEVILANIIDYSGAKSMQLPEQQISQSFLSQVFSELKRLFPVPAWIYQPLLTTLMILLFIMPAFSKGNEAKNLQLFISDYVHYIDSVKYIQQNDKTMTCRNSF